MSRDELIEFAVLWATHARHAADPDRAYAESARLLTLANGVAEKAGGGANG